MALGLETFTLLAVLDARDQASAIYERVATAVENFSTSIKGAADTAAEAAASIDESLLKTASGADALELAEAKVTGAKQLDADATKVLADAEQELLAARANAAAAADGDTEATTRLATASKGLSDAQKEAAITAKGLRDAIADQQAVADATDAKLAAQAGATEEATVSSSDLGEALAGYGKAAVITGVAVGAIGALSLKSAASFQTMTTVLETSGGETASNIQMVRNGILQLAQSTGTSVQELTNGMYMIGSAGYTGAKGLAVLQSAAQGAKAEGADLGTVSNALTTVMNNYYGTLQKGQTEQDAANEAMDQMIAIVQNGKTTTEALAGSLQNVLPVAAAVGLKFSDVGGAMATLTASGMSADMASQDLANTIRNLTGGNMTAAKEMQNLGLNVIDLKKNLGTEGLEGTLKEVTNAIQNNMGPAGTVVVSAFQNSAAATQNLNEMMAKMPPNLKDLADQIVAGTIGTKDLRQATYGLNTAQAKQISQLEEVVGQTHEFNTALTSGTPAQQTAAQALETMLGGATGLNTALMLSSNNYKTLTKDTNAVAAAGAKAGSSVEGWSVIQGTMNQKLSEMKETVDTTGIAIGTALMPWVMKLLNGIEGILGPLAKFISGHQTLTVVILGAVAAFGTLVGIIMVTSKVVKGITGAYNDAKNAITLVGRALGLISKEQKTATAATEENTAAESGNMKQRASVTEGIEGEGWALEEETATQEEATAATEAQTAANEEGLGAWITSGAAMAANGVKMIALKAIQLAGAAASYVASGAMYVFGAAVDFATGPIGIIIIAIVAIVAVFVLLWTKCAWFRDFWIDLWHIIVGAASDAWNFIKQVFDKAIAGLEEDWNAIKQAAHDLWQWFVDYIMFQVDAVKDIINWFSDLASMFVRWFDDVKTAVSDGINDVVNFFEELPRTILNLLSNAGSWLLNVGKDIISGLWNGIQNSAGALENQVKGLAGDVTGWFKDALGIFSPSLVMATEIGQYIPSGIAKGMTDNTTPLNNAVKAVTQGAVNQGRTGLSSASLPLSGAGAGGGSGVTINLDLRNAQMMSDKDMNNLVAKVGRAVATQILPQGGVRVNQRR